MPTIGLITTSDDAIGYQDIDLEPVIAALGRGGNEAIPIVWHDAGLDLERFDLLLVRSPWDYSERSAEFLAWLTTASGLRPLHNPHAVIRWNLDKRYLLELDVLGVPIVPTTVCSSVADVFEAAAASGSDHVVAKPNVSAGSRDTALLPAQAPELAPLAEQILRQGKRVLVQPAIDSVREAGELASLYFDGRYSHTVRKGPILAPGGGFLGGEYTEEITAADAPAGVRAVCDAAMSALHTICAARLGVAAPLLYARIDVVQGPAGPLLLEAELFEPSLFLATAPGSADAFAAAVSRRLPVSDGRR